MLGVVFCGWVIAKRDEHVSVSDTRSGRQNKKEPLARARLDCGARHCLPRGSLRTVPLRGGASLLDEGTIRNLSTLQAFTWLIHGSLHLLVLLYAVPGTGQL